MRSAMVGLMLFILVTSTHAGTIVYDFEDESQLTDWSHVPTSGEPYIVQWYIENGELVGFVKEPSMPAGQGIYIGDDTWGDYTYEVQVKLEQVFPQSEPALGGSTAFVAMHYHETTSEDGLTVGWFPFIGLCNNSRPDWDAIIEGNFVAGEVSNLPQVEENRWYKVRFEAQGNHYRTFLDDKPLLEFESGPPEHAYGGTGFAVRNCEVHFDNVVITGDSIPDMLNVAPVSPKSMLATTWGCIRK